MSYFKAKTHPIQFRLGLPRRPRWGSLQRSPSPLAEFKGPTSNGRERRGREGTGSEGKGGKGKEGGGEGPLVLAYTLDAKSWIKPCVKMDEQTERNA